MCSSDTEANLLAPLSGCGWLRWQSGGIAALNPRL